MRISIAFGSNVPKGVEKATSAASLPMLIAFQ